MEPASNGQIFSLAFPLKGKRSKQELEERDESERERKRERTVSKLEFEILQ